VEHAAIVLLSIALLLALRYGGPRHYHVRIVRVQPLGLKAEQRENRRETTPAVRFEIPKDFQWNSPVPAPATKEESDIASALMNLGAKREKAKAVAHQAIKKGSDWDSRMKWALQNAV